MAEAPMPPTSAFIYYWGTPKALYKENVFRIEFTSTTTVQEIKLKVQNIAKGNGHIGGMSFWKPHPGTAANLDDFRLAIAGDSDHCGIASRLQIHNIAPFQNAFISNNLDEGAPAVHLIVLPPIGAAAPCLPTHQRNYLDPPGVKPAWPSRRENGEIFFTKVNRYGIIHMAMEGWV